MTIQGLFQMFNTLPALVRFQSLTGHLLYLYSKLISIFCLVTVAGSVVKISNRSGSFNKAQQHAPSALDSRQAARRCGQRYESL